jgi:hypothetical protein
MEKNPRPHVEPAVGPSRPLTSGWPLTTPGPYRSLNQRYNVILINFQRGTILRYFIFNTILERENPVVVQPRCPTHAHMARPVRFSTPRVRRPRSHPRESTAAAPPPTSPRRGLPPLFPPDADRDCDPNPVPPYTLHLPR